MSQTPTPHNHAIKGQIAETVLMQGDPLRTQYIAEHYLENAEQFTAVRNMYGYTGTYKGKQLSVMGHGVGMPSIGVYTYELFHFYGVKNIIRTGSAGAMTKKLGLRDIVLAQGSCTDSNYAAQYQLQGTMAPIADFDLLRIAYETAQKMNLSVAVGNVISTDVFYQLNPNYTKAWADMGVLAVEMESAALYMNAAEAGGRALCMCTISDHLITQELISTEERQTGFDNMIRLGLETAIQL